MPKTKYRIRWEPELEPDFSWLEQWDTPIKYYGEQPKCRHGSDMVYERGRWESDKDACEACAHVPESKAPDLHSDKGGVILEGERRLSFEEYIRSYGDPDRHEMLCALVERCCPYCTKWQVVDSLGNVGFLLFGPARQVTGTFSEKEAAALADEYQREESLSLLREARAAESEAVDCSCRAPVAAYLRQIAEKIGVPWESAQNMRLADFAAQADRIQEEGK